MAPSPFSIRTASPAAPLWAAGVRREVLPNGLTLLVLRDDSAPVVAAVTHVKAGFFDEPDRWIGISHVLEHMFFKGTERRGVGEVARETKAAGGYLNAHTSYDHTSYFVVLPADRLAAALDIQSDALRNSVVDAGELARELQVIIQEAKRKLDSPSSVAYETLHEVMYDRHRMRRWRIGTEAQLAGYTRDDLVGYYRSRYLPERTVVAIVGAVEPEQALALARTRYGDWPAAPGAVDPSPEEPPRVGVRTRTLRGDVAQAELALGWRTVPPLDPDAVPLDLAAAVLSAGRGSWLYRALRETGLATAVSAHNYSPTELGVFGVAAECEPERLGEVLAAIAAGVGRMVADGPAEADLERARTLLQARWARRMEPMEGRAAALAGAEALGGVHLLDEEYAALGSATAGDVREAARRWLRPDSVSAVAYLPDGRGAALTPELLGEAFASPAAPAAGPPPPPVITAATRRSVGGSRTCGVLHVPLPGADLLVRRKTGVPLVTLGVYAPRVTVEPPALAGIGALAVRTSLRGAAGLDAAALAFAAERLGGSLAPSATVDWLGFSTVALRDRLDDAAALLAAVVAAPILADSSIAAERQLMAAEAMQVADDMFRFPFQLAFRAAFGDAGYGLPVGGLPDTIPAIDPAAVRAWHASGIDGVRRTVVAVGDDEPERIAEELAAAFDDGVRRAAPLRPPADPWALDGHPVERSVERAKAQSAFAMIFPGPARRAPERHAAEVWAAVASGLGGRLFDALRDRRSLAYTVLASAWQKSRAGALVSYIATSPEREDEAREQMLIELRRFADEPVAAAELAQAASYLAGQAQIRRQSAGALAGEILEAWISGDGLSELADPAAAYRAVTAAEVQGVAERSLDPARRAEGVVHGGRS
jgi:zinc protease